MKQQVKSSDYPEVYENLGILTKDLGCIMINTEPVPISDIVKDEDYYYSEEKEYVNGNVSEDVPHVTLLYGLMHSGPAMKKVVDMVLKGWKVPELMIEKVGFFYGEQADYVAIVAFIQVSDELKEGNARLRLLPHIDTFDEYHPHLTLAYVKSSSNYSEYVEKLNDRLRGLYVDSIDINYGG